MIHPGSRGGLGPAECMGMAQAQCPGGFGVGRKPETHVHSSSPCTDEETEAQRGKALTGQGHVVPSLPVTLQTSPGLFSGQGGWAGDECRHTMAWHTEAWHTQLLLLLSRVLLTELFWVSQSSVQGRAHSRCAVNTVGV